MLIGELEIGDIPFNESNIISNVTTLRTVIEHEDYKPGYEVSFVIPKNML